MLNMPISVSLFEESSYMTHEYQLGVSEILYETATLLEKTELFEYASDEYSYNVLFEDATAIKTGIVNAINKLIEIIKGLTLKFQNMALTLVAKNKKWLEGIKDVVQKDTVSDNFTFEMFPYWTVTSKVINYNIPEFTETSEEFLNLLNDADAFRSKYFKDLYVTKDGKSTFDPNTAFRGGKTEKIAINKATFLSKAESMINFVETYSETVKKIINKNNSIIDILKRAVSKIRTAPIQESVDDFVDTIHTLLEAESTALEPATSTSIATVDKDNKDSEKKENTTDKSDVKKITHSRQQYATLCYEVNSARMRIMEETYNAFVKCLMSAKHSKLKR